MSITSFIRKVAVQTVVYWGNPTNNGSGGFNFAEAVEIKCRWDDISEVITDANGREIISSAKLLVTDDYDVEGYVYLGELSDFDSSVDLTKPKDIKGAYFIAKIEKTPMIKSTTEFVRTIYLQNK